MIKPASQEIVEHEILDWLCKAWSGQQNLIIADATHQSSSSLWTSETKPHKILYSRAPSLNLSPLDNWRITRFSCWHESMHEKLTKTIPSMPSNLALNIFNIVEDIRIEKMGLQTYKGYIPEYGFYIATCSAHRPSVDKSDNPLLETLCQMAYTNKYKGKFPFDQTTLEQIKVFAERIHRTKHRRDSVKLTNEIYEFFMNLYDNSSDSSPQAASSIRQSIPPFNDLSHHMSTPQQPQQEEQGGDQENQQSQQPQQAQQSQQIKDEINKIAKELNLDITPSESVKEEFESMKKRAEEVEDELSDKDDLTKIVEDNSIGRHFADTSRTYYQLINGYGKHSSIVSQINQIKALLRKWRIGYVDQYDTHGELDIQEFIAYKHENGRKDVFLDRTRLSPISSFIVLIDCSESLKLVEVPYLQMCAIIAEGLKSINVPFTIIGFQGYSAISVIKALKEPFNGNILAEKRMDGDTPMYTALNIANEYAKQKNIKNIVIITDGEPTDDKNIKPSLSPFKNSPCRIFMIGFASTLWERKRMSDEMKKLSPFAYQVVPSLSDLPFAFFKMLQEGAQ